MCRKGNLIERRDGNTNLTERFCPVCVYYDSDSEAYRLHPELFRNLGRIVLGTMRAELTRYGFYELEPICSWR